MCGRYSLYTEEQDKEIMRIIKSLDERYPGNEMKKGEIYPTNTAPVICRMDGEIRPELSTCLLYTSLAHYQTMWHLRFLSSRHLNMKIRSFGTFLYKNRKEMKVWKN